MPKRFNTNIGIRDLQILTAVEQTPITVAQLCRLSAVFDSPFRDEHNLRRRLRKLTSSGLLRSWCYAIVSEGRSPQYFKLSRDGYRLLHGSDANLPNRRFFEEVSHGHHQHTFALAETIVRLSSAAKQQGIELRHFARENSVKLQAGGFTMYPDCAFQLFTKQRETFHFVVELDNGTERVRTRHDVESIERKIRGYDAHQSQYAANDSGRYIVIFVTTRSEERSRHILQLADTVVQNRQRTVFVGCSLDALLQFDPFVDAIFSDHRGLKRRLLPLPIKSDKKRSTSMTRSTVPC